MKSICQNCQKEYQPKRRGGKYCSTACRVSVWEKAQPLPSVSVHADQHRSTHEQYLAIKIDAYAQEANRLLVQMKDGQGGTEAIHRMVKLVQMVGSEVDNLVVREVLKPRISTPQ